MIVKLGKLVREYRAMFAVLLFAASFATFMAAGQGTPSTVPTTVPTNVGTPSTETTTVINTLCGLVKTVQEVIFFVALALMILGGSLYAAAHILPAQQRGALQGYGMGMIIGGVVGVILVLVAPFLLQQLLPATNGGITTAQLTSCSIF